MRHRDVPSNSAGFEEAKEFERLTETFWGNRWLKNPWMAFSTVG